MISDDELIYLSKLLDDVEADKASRNLLDFTKYTLPNFEPSFFHNTYYEILDKFANGEIKRLIVSVPPQHGKSEGSSRRLPAYLFGRNPKLRIALASYNATFASKFNRQVQRIIEDEKYQKVFPETSLNSKNVSTDSKGSWLRNSEEFEIVGHGGYFKAIGVGGGLTGNSVDIMIMDDLYKDYQDATSPTISESVWDWYVSVVKTRLHNDSQELIVFTRWDENDVIGRLEKQNKVLELDYDKPIEETLDKLGRDIFLKINFEAIKTGGPTLLDPREPGQVLWDSKHSIEKLEETRSLDVKKFDALYQGNPKNKEGLLYDEFNTYVKPPQLKIIKAYCDTADKGKDYLCSIVYGVPLDSKDEKLYVLDVVFTQKPMEETEIMVSNQYNAYNVNEVRIESNNGARSFARTIDSMTNNSVVIKSFHQSKNKEARILSNSAAVNRTMVMPFDWKTKYRDFYLDISNFKRDFRNSHDDAEDCLTGCYESEFSSTNKQKIIW